MFSKYLSKIIAGSDLTRQEMDRLMQLVLEGQATDAQIGALMAALAAKGETYEELAGAATAMRRSALRIQAVTSPVVDTCGTGGDHSNTFNISTTTAFVVAGAGVTVAKHGNRSVSSKSGSADVLEALGVVLDTAPEIVEEAVQQIGIGFLFAPLYHSAMRHAAPARKQVGIRSIFNMLGPLTNPAGADCQLLGVYAPQLTEMFARALQQLGTKAAFVVNGHDGLDEISICAPTRVTELRNGQIKTYDLHPETYFGKRADANLIKGGDPQENAAITTAVLKGEDSGPCRRIVLLNAAAALVAAGKAEDINAGIELAARSIDSGSAIHKLEALVDFTRSNS